MITVAILGGAIAIMLGVLVLAYGSKSRGSMDVSMGVFKGPVWYLLFVLGILLIAIGVV